MELETAIYPLPLVPCRSSDYSAPSSIHCPRLFLTVFSRSASLQSSMAATVARANLNPEAPIFTPLRCSQLSPHPCSNLPLYYPAQPVNPVFFSTAPTCPFFLLNFLAPNINLNPNFIGRSPLFWAGPPERHDKVFVSHSGQVSEKEMACMGTNPVKWSNQYFGGRDGAGGGSFREKPKGKKAYRMKPKNCDYIRAKVGHYPRAAAREKISRNERAKPVLPVSQDGNCTTVMVRNIPGKYTRKLLLEFLDQHCKNENQDSAYQNSYEGESGEVDAVSAFDFLYLPIDFNTGMNKGYAFVNFTSPNAAWKFIEAADDQTWDLFNSSKRRQIARARLQGKEELVRHFENMGFPCQSDEVLPVCFSPPRDGSGRLVNETTVGRRIGRKKNGDEDHSSTKI